MGNTGNHLTHPPLRNPLRGLRVPLVMHAVRVHFPSVLVSARSFFFFGLRPSLYPLAASSIWPVSICTLSTTRVLVQSLAFYVRT